MKKTLSSVGNILKSESSSKGDKSFYGKVLSKIIKNNKVVGYNVQVGDSTIEARKLAGAEVNNTVLCTTLANGTTVVTGTLNGDADAIEALTEAGNASTQAGTAYDKAIQAEGSADLAMDKANEAIQDAGNAEITANWAANQATNAYNKAAGIENHFWYDSSGAHVSQVSGSASSGMNTLINSGGMAVRNGTSTRSLFTNDAAYFYDTSGNVTGKFGAGVVICDGHPGDAYGARMTLESDMTDLQGRAVGVSGLRSLSLYGGTLASLGGAQINIGDGNGLVYINGTIRMNDTKITIDSGDTISGTWWGAAYLTGSKQDLRVTIPLNKIITASSVRCTRASLTTRQDGNYTHGSAASSPVNWTRDSASISPSGVNVSLSRTTTTSAVNNAPIGVAMDYTFVFS